MLKLVVSLGNRNQVLIATRDLLLPRLVSGELDVSDLDIEVPTFGEDTIQAPSLAPAGPTPLRAEPKKAAEADTAEVEPTERISSTSSIDDFDTDEVMAAFRQAARGRGTMSREELLKRTSAELGYQRLGSHIGETLRGHLRAAIRRRIIEAEGSDVRPDTHTMDDYTRDELVGFLCSVMRKGTTYEREDVVRSVANYLGFRRLRDTTGDPIRSAINGAIRRHVLGYEGNQVWRED